MVKADDLKRFQSQYHIHATLAGSDFISIYHKPVLNILSCCLSVRESGATEANN